MGSGERRYSLAGRPARAGSGASGAPFAVVAQPDRPGLSYADIVPRSARPDEPIVVDSVVARELANPAAVVDVFAAGRRLAG
jgi:hypothetical protein